MFKISLPTPNSPSLLNLCMRNISYLWPLSFYLCVQCTTLDVLICMHQYLFTAETKSSNRALTAGLFMCIYVVHDCMLLKRTSGRESNIHNIVWHSWVEVVCCSVLEKNTFKVWCNVSVFLTTFTYDIRSFYTRLPL